MTLIVAVVLASLILSFLCSLCEAAFYTVTPAKVEALRASGSSGQRLWLLRQGTEDAIAGIGTINTIAQTAGAAWAGALTWQCKRAPFSVTNHDGSKTYSDSIT